VLFFFYIYYRLERARPLSAEWIERRDKPLFSLKRKGSLTKIDALPILLITGVYAVTTFLNLGNTVSPQTFQQFDNTRSLVIELREPARVERIFYFTGLYHGSRKRAYTLEFSSDGDNWTEQYKEFTDKDETRRTSGLSQEYSETFRWLNANLLADQPDDTRYIRVTAIYTPLELGELSIIVHDPKTGGPRTLSAAELSVPSEAESLFDEPQAVPERYDVLNSSHFDEIYHARTAYEHLRGIYPYEKTHPPLGKLITASGISLFGMTPFGWRFMPALFGVLMLPLLYILLKWMFGKVSVAVCGTLLFAFDFMHFVQTRISTIDVYAVFFILCMYLFMYRYITSDLDGPFWKTSWPLVLAGLSFGVGAASKWVCVYAGAGLLVLFLIYLFRRANHYRLLGRSFLPFFLGTGLVALFSFIIVPGAVYIACYIPYVTPNAPDGGFENAPAFLKAVWEACWNNQSYMYKYHADLVAEHAYAARWYEWLVDWKPILYYWNPLRDEGTRGSLWAFTNPLTTWAGLGAIIVCGMGIILRRSHAALFILIGYLSQLLPWTPISRITFPYHYFPSMLFICIALAYLFNRMVERNPKRGTLHMVTFTVIATALFVLFYPVLTGTQMPEWYPRHLLQWLPNGNWLM
jgi:4-amino-4-deoxy-L-arabinose transferase-like glycosyltransferase